MGSPVGPTEMYAVAFPKARLHLEPAPCPALDRLEHWEVSLRIRVCVAFPQIVESYKGFLLLILKRGSSASSDQVGAAAGCCLGCAQGVVVAGSACLGAVVVSGGVCFAMQGADQGADRFAQGVCSSCWQCLFSDAACALGGVVVAVGACCSQGAGQSVMPHAIWGLSRCGLV